MGKPYLFLHRLKRKILFMMKLIRNLSSYMATDKSLRAFNLKKKKKENNQFKRLILSLCSFHFVDLNNFYTQNHERQRIKNTKNNILLL